VRTTKLQSSISGSCSRFYVHRRTVRRRRAARHRGHSAPGQEAGVFHCGDGTQLRRSDSAARGLLASGLRVLPPLASFSPVALEAVWVGGLTSLPIRPGTFDGRVECASPTKCRPGSDEWARIFGRSKRKAWCPTLWPWASPSVRSRVALSFPHDSARALTMYLATHRKRIPVGRGRYNAGDRRRLRAEWCDRASLFAFLLRFYL